MENQGIGVPVSYTELDLTRNETGAQSAREAVMQLLGDNAPVAFTRDAILLTGELATNALTHSAGECRMEARFEQTPITLRVEVTDESSQMPTDDCVGSSRAQGRGLQLVHTVASDWGAVALQGGGKSVWFELNLRAGENR